MSKLRQKHRAARKAAKPSPDLFLDWLDANQHLRKRIERAIPANYILALSVCIQADTRFTSTEHAFAAAVQPVAERAATEPFLGLSPERAWECKRAMQLVSDFAVGIGEEGGSVTVPIMVLAIKKWLAHAVETGKFSRIPGSAFDEAFSALERVVTEPSDDPEVKRKDREKHAAAAALYPLMQARFEYAGLFIGAADDLLAEYAAAVQPSMQRSA